MESLGTVRAKHHSVMCAICDTVDHSTGREKQALALLLLATLPLRSVDSRRIVQALVTTAGRLRGAEELAASVGMANRFQVARTLRRESLPQIEELSAWVRLLAWSLRFEAHPTSLARIALDEGLDLSVCIRTIRRLTGTTWTDVRTLGPPWIAASLAARCAGLATRAEAVAGPRGRRLG